MAHDRQGQVGAAAGAVNAVRQGGGWWPAVRWHRIRHPELAGLVMRRWERQGLLVSYLYTPRLGFELLAMRPRWRWLLALLLGRLPEPRSLRLRRRPQRPPR